MARWTASEIPDLTDKTVLVTGANSGLGYEATIELARHGAEVVMACRSEERGTAAVSAIQQRAPGATLRLASLDLADLASVRKFAAEFTAAHKSLDILINNAGVMAVPTRMLTADGFEMQFGTNHLGHFALTGLLLPILLNSPGPRVVTVTSFAHRTSGIRFDDLQGERGYRKWPAYGQSKLANVVFTFELDRRAQDAKTNLLALAAHPGFAATHLQDNTSFSAARIFAQSAAKGSLPILFAATAEGVAGGDFFGPNGLFQAWGYPKRVKAARAAADPRTAGRLWEVSEQLTGVIYDFED